MVLKINRLQIDLNLTTKSIPDIIINENEVFIWHQ